MKKAGLDRLAAVYTAIETVRRGGTVSLSGVYGGMADPMSMMSLFDKQIQLRMGQANVKRWIPDIMPFLTDDDPARRGRICHSSAATRRCCGGVRHVPAQGGRRGQDHAQAVVMIRL